jgi:DNA-directed RNA polymerase specialized sigma subunit
VNKVEFVSQIENETERTTFETAPDIQRESQAVLDSMKRRKNDRIAVYFLKETILKEIAEKIKLSQHFFLYLVRELSDTLSRRMEG